MYTHEHIYMFFVVFNPISVIYIVVCFFHLRDVHDIFLTFKYSHIEHEFKCLMSYFITYLDYIVSVVSRYCSIRLIPIFIIINNAEWINIYLPQLICLLLFHFNKCLKTNLLKTSRKDLAHLEYESGGFHPICGLRAWNLTWSILKIPCHLPKWITCLPVLRGREASHYLAGF